MIFVRMISDNTTILSGRYIIVISDFETQQKVYYYDFDRSQYPKRYNILYVTTDLPKGRYKLDIFETYADVEPLDLAHDILNESPIYSSHIFVEEQDNNNKYIAFDEQDFE